jgi:alpha-beta hydrolase superfamily lysophospholipase
MLAVTSGVKELEPVSPFSGISTAVQAAILFYPPMGDRHSNKFSFGYGRKAPVTYLRPGLPPVLLLQGAKDKLVSAKDTKEVAVDFTRSGVENQLVIVAEEGHGFGLSPNSPLRPVVQTFLAEHLIHKL